MIQRIQQILDAIREGRDEMGDLEGRIVFFIVLIVVLAAAVLFAFALVMLAFTEPKTVLPIYITIFVLWHCYKRL